MAWQLTSVHRAEHARDETINTPRFLHKWNERGYAAFIVCRMSEVCEDHALERVYVVLQRHKVRDGLITFKRSELDLL